MKKVPAPQVATAKEAMKGDLPEAVQEALGDLAGAAREGLLALSVGVGLGVVHELMEAEVTEVCGPKGKNDPDRTATRHGHEDGKVTLGGRRATVSRPRMRSVPEDRELGLATYEHFGERDPLSDLVFERIVCQRPSRIPQGRPSNLPTRGHDFSPPAAIGSPHA